MNNKPPMTLDQAVAILSRMKHWSIKVVNSKQRSRRHSCTIWDGQGRRVTATRIGPPINAVIGALEKLKQPKRAVRNDERRGPQLGVFSAD